MFWKNLIKNIIPIFEVGVIFFRSVLLLLRITDDVPNFLHVARNLSESEVVAESALVIAVESNFL